MRLCVLCLAARAVVFATLGCGDTNTELRPAPSPADAGAPLNHCPIGPFGGPMVEVPALDGSRYCVDATEVTNEQYAKFLATAPTTKQWPPLCVNEHFLWPIAAKSWTFEPVEWPVPEPHGQHPVVDINWCAGYAFCAANGKRLCGRIGGGALVATVAFGGEQVGDSPRDPTISEWMNACSRGGSRPYGYGMHYEPGRCTARREDLDHPLAPTSAVPTPTCEGGFDGLYDLGGSVFEMLAQCWPNTTYEVAGCTAGGSGTVDETHPGCGVGGFDATTPHGSSPLVGLRCCADIEEAVDGGR